MMGLREHLMVWLKGCESAIDFILAMHQIAETWDDLIDGDRETTPKAINAAFYTSLITLPRNPFYQQHFHELSPIVESAILDWHTANALEKRNSGDDLRTAYTLRCGAQMLTVMSARIIGGQDWAQNVNLEIRSVGDSWADYSKQFEVL